MTQKTSPFVEAKYGWDYGESGWNSGMDENLTKFSFLFDKNIDGIVSSLPSVVNGTAYFLTTDNRIYFGVSGGWYSTPIPKWFTLILRTTGANYQFNGTSLVAVTNNVDLSSQVQAIQVTLSSLGTASLEDVGYFASSAQLEVASAQANNYTDAKVSTASISLSNEIDAVELNVTTLQNSYLNLQNSSDITKGAALVGYRGQTVFSRLNQVVNIKDAPFSVTGNNTTLDHSNLVACLDYAAAQGLPVIVPAGIYQFNNWIPLPDKLKMVFEPGARWKLTTQTVLGGFVCGGYTQALVRRPFTDVEIYGIDLDCSDLPNENGFNAINAVNVKVYNPKIRNVKFSTVNQGGKAFQFEGDIVDGVHIYAPYIENCTIGINSHADAFGGVEVARHISYYDVVMKNVDVPFNTDSQFATPENGVPTNMSTFVHGVNLFNCGKLTFPGASSPTGGGIICGDRGYGLKVSGLRLVNTTAYGAIGAVVRGTMFNVSLTDFKIETSAMTAVVDLAPVGYGFPSSGAHVCTINIANMTVLSKLNYVAKGYAYGKMGDCSFDIAINSVTATLTGITDGEAAYNGLGVLNLTLVNLINYNTGFRTLTSLLADGNTTALCFPTYREGTWTPVDTSGAALSFTVSGTSRWVQRGREITANTRFDYPTTANTAISKIGGLPFTSSNLSTMAGVANIAYTSEPTLARGYVIGGTTDIQPSIAGGGDLTNATLSGDSIYMTITYFVA